MWQHNIVDKVIGGYQLAMKHVQSNYYVKVMTDWFILPYLHAYNIYMYKQSISVLYIVPGMSMIFLYALRKKVSAAWLLLDRASTSPWNDLSKGATFLLTSCM